jgi:hypothetical protein
MSLSESSDWLPSRSFVIRLSAFTAVALIALFVGCGKPFNVKRQPDLPPANYVAKGSFDVISIQAQAIFDEDLLYDTFDANLIVAGILPVRAMLTNSGEHSVDVQKARFEIREPSGRNFKAVSARDAFKRLISYYEISAYNKSGYKESLNDFTEFGLDTKTPLANGQSRQGVLFFLVPNETSRQAGLMLVVSKLDPRQSGAVELKLN